VKGDAIDCLTENFYKQITYGAPEEWTEQDWRDRIEQVIRVGLQYQVNRDTEQIRAVLEGIYEDARGAITAPVHHALMGAASRLERLLGIQPGTPGFNRGMGGGESDGLDEGAG